jgi:hypothetical protein
VWVGGWDSDRDEFRINRRIFKSPFDVPKPKENTFLVSSISDSRIMTHPAFFTRDVWVRVS